MRSESYTGAARDLPEDVLRQCAAAQNDRLAAGHRKVFRNLEDPDILTGKLH